MNELIALIRKSKTAKSGLVTILWGILILFGVTEGNPPQTIDDLSKPETSNKMEMIVGLGALASGAMTVKGRNDVEKRNKENENE